MLHEMAVIGIPMLLIVVILWLSMVLVNNKLRTGNFFESPSTA